MMIRPAFLFLLMAVFYNKSTAQYYYKDIVSNKELLSDMSQYREQKIRSVKVKSFEEDGSPSEGFFCEKKISRDSRTVETMNRSYVSAPSMLTSYFDKKGLLEKTTDSSDITSRSSSYRYNDGGQLISVLSSIRSSDDDFTNEIREEHIYQYNEKGILKQMIKVKNNTDSTLFEFSTDEKSNITIEKDTKSGAKYYYYYDTKNRLTDVAHSNDFQHRITPDYSFEYNGLGLMTQMTNTEEGAQSYYFIWKYFYDNGLRIREKCYNKEKRLMGTIEYEYK